MSDERAGSGTGEPVRVLLCDDHALFRRGLMMVLEEEAGVEVVAEAEHGREAVAMAENFAPDVVLMDVHMPGLDGVAATREIALLHPSARIIMLTVTSDQDGLFDAIKAGATTFMLKETAIDEVAAAVVGVAGGQSLLSAELATQLAVEFDTMAARGAEATDSTTPVLGTREAAVLQRVADGMSNVEVAADLDISENTVKNHLRNVLGKLHQHNRVTTARHEAGDPAGPGSN